jgi:protein-S-isoprenylcysteine O-methyltransferase Ste14
MLVGGVVGGYYLDARLFSNVHTVANHILAFMVGTIPLRIVLAVSQNTGRTLAKYGREGDDIPRLETNKLSTEGLYALMRHPMHLGLLFVPWTMAILAGSPSFFLLIAPIEMLFVVAMIVWFEEPEAIRKFGDAYRDYQKRVPMFCLKPACFRALLTHVPKRTSSS